MMRFNGEITSRLKRFSRQTLGRPILPMGLQQSTTIVRRRTMRLRWPNALWRLLPALSLLCVSEAFAQVGPPNPILCGSYIASSFSATSVSTMLLGQVGKGIFICGYSASTQNTTSQTNFQLTYTTSSPAAGCNTAPASIAITPPHGVTSNAPLVDHIEYATAGVPVVSSSVSPSNLCIGVTGTGANLQFILYYSQF